MKVCGLLSQKYRTSWAEVASVIRTEVSARCANMMEPFFSEVYPPGSINTQLDRLAKLLSKFRNAQLAISDLRTLARHLAAVNVLPKAFIDLSLVYHPGYTLSSLFIPLHSSLTSFFNSFFPPSFLSSLFCFIVFLSSLCFIAFLSSLS